MTAPAFVWAMEQGFAHQLLPSDRLTLIVLADRGNCKRVCWPSLQLLMEDTGLSKRTLLTVVHRLANAGLISIEKWGRRQKYHILRPAEGDQPVQNSTRSKARKVQNSTHQLVQSVPPLVQNSTLIGAKCHPETTKETEKKLSARASETAEAAASQRAHAALAAAPSLPETTTPPPVVAPEPTPDPAAVRTALAAITVALGGSHRMPPPGEPYVPIRRGPVDPIRTPEEQIAILLGAVPTPSLGASP